MREDYQDAVRYLEHLARGTVSLGLPAAPAAPAASMAAWSAATPVMRRIDTEGY